jgi:meso-butanediol dehydrogenase/(S,S)-butanediol dehydrogenase/diacetyl reductase
MTTLDGKVAIVTGGASGIGLATAKLFGKLGARVVIADLDEHRVSSAAEQAKQAGAVDAAGITCDVGQEEQVVALGDQTLSRFGRIDVIVNNAGVMTFRPIIELAAADWERVLRVDLLGAFFFTKWGFIKMGQGSAIVNVSSVHAVETTVGVAPYAAAKAGLLSLTRSAALEGKPKGIRVNAVLPGAIDTPMLWANPNVKSGLEHIERTDVGSTDDVARVIAFLASDDAAFIQGAAIQVDGGRLGQL